MHLVVTGASGFVGGAIARHFQSQGHRVTGYGRRPPEELTEPLPDYHQWDLLDGPIPPVEDVDAVVHSAARVDDWGAESIYRAINVNGTRTVMEGFPSAGRFVHISSSSVYCRCASGRALREEDPIGEALLTAYARSKSDAERLILASGRNAVILRPHVVYGRGDTTLAPRVLAARRWGWLAVPGSGRNHLSVTHIGNLVHAVECALLGPVRKGVFNIADAEPAPVDQLLHALLTGVGEPTRLLHVPRPLALAAAILAEGIALAVGSTRAPVLTRYRVHQVAEGHTLDLTRAFDELGYRPKRCFRDAWEVNP